jgi:hypothetical protein
MAHALVERYEHLVMPHDLPLKSALHAPASSEPGGIAADVSWTQKSRAWLSTLRRERSLTVHPVEDLRLGGKNIRYTGARIKKVALTQVLLQVDEPRLPFDFTIRIEHSGESVIYEQTTEYPDGAGFYFRKGERDDPISWTFQCHWSIDAKGKAIVEIVPAQPSSTSMRSTLLTAQKLDLEPYLPALYAPWTIHLIHSFDDPLSFPVITGMDLELMIECTRP